MKREELKEKILGTLPSPKNISNNIKTAYFNKKSKPFYQSKGFISAAASVLAGASLFALIVIPAFGNFTSAINLNEVNTDNAFSYQIASSINMLNGSNQNNGGASNLIQYARNPGVNKEKLDEVAQEVIQYLPAVEGALTGENLLNSVTYETPSEGHDVKLVITTKDLLGNKDTFTLEYVETLIEDGKDADDYFDDDDHDYEDDNDKDHDHDRDDLRSHKGGKPHHGRHEYDDEVEFLIEGILTHDDIQYNLIGIHEVGEDDGETEIEMTLKYGLPSETSFDGISIKDYVLVSQEIEKGESSYQYLVVKDYLPVYNYSLEVERNEVTLAVLGVETGFSIMNFELFNKDGKTFIRAFVDVNFEAAIIIFEKKEDGTYTYNLPEDRPH